MKILAPLLLLALAACSTAQIQQTCAEAQSLVVAAQPFLSIAPIEVRAAVTVLGAGSVGCQSAEYAALRERIIGWLKARQ